MFVKFYGVQVKTELLETENTLLQLTTQFFKSCRLHVVRNTIDNVKGTELLDLEQ
jgi:hypothetical protein